MQPQSPIEAQKQKERQARAQRASIAVAGFTIWAILAALCIAAFWQHIDSIKPAYPILAKLGAVASEVIVGFMVYWHCFNHHIGVRKTALWLGIFLSSVALVHAGALYGMSEAKQAQLETEKRVKDGLTDMSKEQMGAAKGRRRGETQQELGKNAQKEFADTVKKGDEKVIASSILPAWYLRGGMYAVLFIMGLICMGICVSKMQNNEDIDADFDGRPDHLQQPQPYYQQYQQPYPAQYPPQYMQPPYQQPQYAPPQEQQRQTDFPDEVGK